MQRIARERVDDGMFLWFKRIVGFKAYRCDPCRTRFFSIRIYRRILPVPADVAMKRPSQHSASQSSTQT